MNPAAIASSEPLPRVARGRSRAVQGQPAGPVDPLPLVAVLCVPARAHAAAAGVGLALARALGGGCGLAAAAGGGVGVGFVPAPAAHRAAMRLRGRGLPATAAGRLVWLADRRGPLRGGADAAAQAAATSAELARAVAAAGVPAAVALPLARTAALDRVLAWHDAIVVVREPEAAPGMVEQALASLAVLGRHVAAMPPPSRLAAALAVAGVRPPVEAVQAVSALGLGGGGHRA